MDKGKISKIEKKKLCIGLLSGVGVIAIILLILYPNSKLKQYMTAVNAYRAGDYTLAISLFTDISDFANSDEMIKDCYYDNAILELEGGNYETAIELFETVSDYKDSDEKIKQCYYENATLELEEGNYEAAIELFGIVSEYEDSSEKIYRCYYELALSEYEQGNLSEGLAYAILVKKNSESLKTEATELVREISKHIKYDNYQNGIELMNEGKVLEAFKVFERLIEINLLGIGTYEKGDLSANKEICRQQLIELGKTFYDMQDYQNAYECWSRSNKVDGFMYPNEYKFCTAYVGLQGDWYSHDKELLFSVEGLTATVYEDFYINSSTEKWEAGTYNGVYPAQTDAIASRMFLFDEESEYICFGSKIYMEAPITDEPKFYRLHCYTEGRGYISSILVYTQSGFSVIDRDNEIREQNRQNWQNREQMTSEPIAPTIGMTGEQVRNSSWGNPIKINKTTFEWGTTEQWCYSNYRYIYFEDGKVTAIQESID